MPLPPAEGERQAKQLIANLLSQKPSQNASNIAAVRIRGSDRKERQIPATFAVIVNPTNYVNVYEAGMSGGGPAGMKLTIVHSDAQPNEYLLCGSASQGASAAEPRRLAQSQLMTPFAGSDFWVADLGLEFLHWPQQRVLKKEMRKGQSCAVLQSINPHPVAGGYSRVVSWIGITHPDEIILVHADGYDLQDRLLKEFDPKSLEKINGAYQLESMEMRNIQAGSRTIIEFNLGAP